MFLFVSKNLLIVKGILADEIHLCGDPCAEKVIRKMVEQTGDEIIVRNFLIFCLINEGKSI